VTQQVPDVGDRDDGLHPGVGARDVGACNNTVARQAGGGSARI